MHAADRRRMATNRLKWDESVALHLRSEDYDVPSFLRGRSTLRSIEIDEIGPVRRRSLLHLQCHFGMDTLSWARRGARVTGVDFSPAAVLAAQGLAAETGLRARFIESNVYDLSRKVPEKFDIVYTAKGALCWLPDIPRWGRVVAKALRPGGRFYLLEDHPFADVFPNEDTTRTLVPRIDYFRDQPQRWEYGGTYAARTARMHHRVSFDWNHPVSEILGALLDAGLRIEFVHEFPFTFWKRFPFMHKDRRGWWRLRARDGLLPLMWSVRARRPA
ncbi:MAG: class I SAM-dependent methyltransferase [Thermoplasmata archaeon]|nr:class I SAM-dependent methyltransferase [Thermoplasmata archaeon]MCI4354161.1 class I SAM-dependent methyltransferase [Thermoplasmata archaeon]